MTKRSLLVMLLAVVMVLSLALVACSGATYTVTFDTDGGSEVTAQTVEEGGTATKPSDPTKDGYTFAGWVDADGEAFDFSTVILADTTVKATWTAEEVTPDTEVSYTVTVDGVEQTVVSGELAVEPEQPTKDGYVFAGWVDADGEAFSFDTAITADTTVTSSWAEAVVVTFVNNGVTTEVVVVKGEVVSTDSIPSTDRTGYQFDGWYAEGVAGVFVDLSTTVIDEDTTYIAFYSAVCTMSFVTGYEDDNVVVEDITALYNDKFVKPTNPEVDGLTFAGWYTDSELTEQYLFGYWAKSDITVYAKWAYAVTLDYNNMTFGSYTLWSTAVGAVGEDATCSIYSIYLGGVEYYNYEMDGFYTIDDEGDKVEFISGVTVITEATTVYINWDIPEVVTMTFETGIEGVTVDSITANYNDKFVQPTNPETDGLTFAGWYTDSELTEQYLFGLWAKYDMTVYAKWVYAVTLDYNNAVTGVSDTHTGSYTLWSSAVGAVGEDATCTIYSVYTSGITTYGREIVGFYTLVDNVETEFVSGTTVITEATTVYVQWSDTAAFIVSDAGVLTKVVLGSETELVIPSTVDGTDVTSIGLGGYNYVLFNSSLTSITVPSSVTAVAANAIYYNPSLTSIVFEGTGLVSLADSALGNNAALETIYIPSSVESMGTTVLGTTSKALVYVGFDKDYAEGMGFYTALKGGASNFVYNATSIDDIIVSFYTGSLTTPHLEGVVEGGTVAFYNGDIATEHAVAWYTDSALTKKFDFATSIVENTSLYGEYEGGIVSTVYTAEQLTTAVAKGGTVILAANISADVVVDSGVVVTIDLNGFTLTNATSHTIANNGTLTIKDSVGTGVVTVSTDNKGALQNNVGGVAVLESGTLTRVEETSNTWYVVKNEGTLTINGGSVVNTDASSSNIANGWYNSSEVGSNVATLTINGGSITGGLNSLKNDEGGVCTINGGTFENTVQHAVMNWNIMTINGGTFTTPEGYFDVYNAAYVATSIGQLTFGADFDVLSVSLWIDSSYNATTVYVATQAQADAILANATITGEHEYNVAIALS